MKRLSWLFFLTMFAAPLAAWAQNPVTDAVRRQLGRAEQNFNAAAEAMPADKYGYKPTPQQMSFGHLMVHVATSNAYMCSSLSGTPQPSSSGVKESDPKAKIVAAVQDSFRFCHQALDKAGDDRLSELIPFFGGQQMTRAAVLIALTNGWADHYGTAAVYLRLNGLTPPTAKK